jgi:hypothetical protein
MSKRTFVSALFPSFPLPRDGKPGNCRQTAESKSLRVSRRGPAIYGADITHLAPVSPKVEGEFLQRSGPPTLRCPPPPEPVRRRYGRAGADINALVEVLYQLLVEVPVDPPRMIAGSPESPCVSPAHE